MPITCSSFPFSSLMLTFFLAMCVVPSTGFVLSPSPAATSQAVRNNKSHRRSWTRMIATAGRISPPAYEPSNIHGVNAFAQETTDRLSPTTIGSSSSTSLSMSSDLDSKNEKGKLPFIFDPNTKGGAVFLSIVLFVIPFIIYNVAVGVFGFDGLEAGKWIGVGFTVLATFGWVGTYVFRVATKDMTYVSTCFLAWVRNVVLCMHCTCSLWTVCKSL